MNQDFELVKQHGRRYNDCNQHSCGSATCTTDRQIAYNCLTMATQECSRRSMSWRLMCLNQPLMAMIPTAVLELMQINDCIVLAGGAVLDLIHGKTPNDYDLFFVTKNVFEANVILDQMRRTKDYAETANAITIIMGSCQVQFIKRCYESVDHVVGGFDLDPCRIVYWQGRAWCTATCWLSMEKHVNYINFNCMSRTFQQRIYKYHWKGYRCSSMYSMKEVHVFKQQIVSHTGYALRSMQYRYFRDHHNPDLIKKLNVAYLLKMKYDQLFIKDQKYTCEELLEIIDIPMYKLLYIPDIKYIYRHMSGLYIIKDNYKYHIQDIRALLRDIIRNRYEWYDRITNTKVANPTTQFTGSFQPLSMRPMDLANQYTHVDTWIYIPAIYMILSPWLTSSMGLTLIRPLRYMIASAYAESMIYAKMEEKVDDEESDE